jgi:glycosyltransferase involved in cell wall biosynthesis
LKNCLQNYEDIFCVVVDDGLTQTATEEDFNTLIKTSGKIGVGKAKNLALSKLIEEGCEHIFLMEDDIEITDPKVFEVYIKTSISSGIKHLNYGLHGNHNLDPNGNPVIRKSINYPDNIVVDLYPNLLGALSYFHYSVLQSVGLIDETYHNALEHVDHTLQIILKGYHPPFRWFADVHNSGLYLKDIVANHEQSVIRSEENFMDNFRKNLDIFISKNNFSVVPNYGPAERNYTETEVLENLKQIWKSQHQKLE